MSPMTDAADVDLAFVAELRLVLHRLGRRIRQRADAGLTPSRMSALSTIARHGPLRLGDLGAREGVGKSSITRIVARLEQDGHIDRIDDPNDGRGALVTITPAGRDLLGAANARAEAYLARQVAALPPGDRDALTAALPVLQRLLAVTA